MRAVFVGDRFHLNAFFKRFTSIGLNLWGKLGGMRRQELLLVVNTGISKAAWLHSITPDLSNSRCASDDWSNSRFRNCASRLALVVSRKDATICCPASEETIQSLASHSIKASAALRSCVGYSHFPARCKTRSFSCHIEVESDLSKSHTFSAVTFAGLPRWRWP